MLAKMRETKTAIKARGKKRRLASFIFEPPDISKDTAYRTRKPEFRFHCVCTQTVLFF
jgi:hypothetical protein